MVAAGGGDTGWGHRVGTQGEGSVFATKGGGTTQAKGTLTLSEPREGRWTTQGSGSALTASIGPSSSAGSPSPPAAPLSKRPRARAPDEFECLNDVERLATTDEFSPTRQLATPKPEDSLVITGLFERYISGGSVYSWGIAGLFIALSLTRRLHKL